MLQNFYKGPTPMSKGHVDAAAGGAFFSLTITDATALIEKMVAKQARERNAPLVAASTCPFDMGVSPW